MLSCRKLEDALDQKTAELIALRRAAMEHNSKAAVRDAALERAAEGLRGAGSGDGSNGNGNAGADWAIPANMGIAAGAAGVLCGPQPVVMPPESDYGGSDSSSPLARQQLYAGSEFASAASGFASSGLTNGSTDTGRPVDGLTLQLEELRLQHGRELAEREARWRAQTEALQTQLEVVRQQAAAATAQQQQQQERQQQHAAAGPGGGSAAALAAQCDALNKERDALRTILDSKVRQAGRQAVELALVLGVVCVCAVRVRTELSNGIGANKTHAGCPAFTLIWFPKCELLAALLSFPSPCL